MHIDTSDDSVVLKSASGWRFYYLGLLVLMPIAWILTSKSIGFLVFAGVMLLLGIVQFRNQSSQTISLKGDVINYKYTFFFWNRNRLIKVADLKKVVTIKPRALGSAVPILLLIGPDPERATMEINAKNFAVEDIQKFLRAVHTQRPDLSIPEVWIDESVTPAQIKRSAIVPTQLGKK